MEQHGDNPKQNVIAIIPARFESTRLPGKLLCDIAGKPLILHTLAQAGQAKRVDRVIVAADDERILNAILEAGGEAVMTSASHQSGSDRIAEVAEGLPKGSIIVNVQGDEPLISPDTIDRVVEAFTSGNADLGSRCDIATAYEPIANIADVLSPDVVKVVTGVNDLAVYFSRSPIPFLRDEVKRYGSLAMALERESGLLRIFKKHTGLYVYNREFLLEFTKMPRSRLEKIEMLEQLRALENGAKIRVVEAASSSVGVDTAEDLERARNLYASAAAGIGVVD